MNIVTEFQVNEGGAFFRCPDCGAAVHMPMRISPASFQELLLAGSLDEALARSIDMPQVMETLKFHVQLNPDVHPTFVNPRPCNHLTCRVINGAIRLAFRIRRWGGRA